MPKLYLQIAWLMENIALFVTRNKTHFCQLCSEISQFYIMKTTTLSCSVTHPSVLNTHLKIIGNKINAGQDEEDMECVRCDVTVA